MAGEIWFCWLVEEEGKGQSELREKELKEEETEELGVRGPHSQEYMRNVGI